MGERKVKTLGKLAILLGLSIGLSASERGQISFASPVAARPQPSARLSSPAQTAGALAVLAGGDSCATATLISAFPFGDSDNTTGKSSDVNTVSSSCIHPDFNRVAGPDLVYQFTSNGTTSLKFTLAPTNSSYDPAIYVLGACGIGTSCGVGSDFGFEGEVEVIGPVILPAGTYFLYVDSYFASEAECDPFINPGCSAGPYNLSIVAGLTTPTPSVTRTPTITRTPTNTATPTNTGTSTPTATPTRTPTPSPTPTSTPNGGITATPTPTPTTTVTPTSTATPAPATRFFTLAPCRVVDTRDAVGPYGGPPLAGGSGRAFTMVGRCGIESGALAVSLNVTVLQPTAAGYLTLYPAGGDLPLASTINYRVDQVRANNAIVRLGPGGNLAVYSGQGGGNVHLIIDVNGFFR